jgi:predicted dehydrogenase
MAQVYRVAIIGCGARGAGRTGAARAHDHWRAYQATGRCHLAALADVRRENAEAFAAEHGDPADPPAVFEDYAVMLREARPDVVSICTWPALHAPMVTAAVEAGVRAIHCEKPVAPVWGEARQMVEAAARAHVLLMFTHQRRFEPQFRAARRLVRSGVIGRLQRLEGTCDNLFDWGTHWFDMFHFYNGEEPARWVLAQVDTRTVRTVFGAPVEGQALSLVQFANGVQGLLITGQDRPYPEVNRLIGSRGVIEVQMPGEDGKWIPIRLRGAGDSDWRIPEIEPADRPGPAGSVAAATEDLLRCLEQGGEPELSAAKALRATELIFASYESARRGGRVELPLQADDASLAALLQARGVAG